MISGLIFDIKEFAIHDGPGIRLTVFLKGCPLRCSWCHNPEGISPEPQVIRRPDGERTAGKSYTPDEVANIINAKKEILASNDGGVTFSGGEPLSQSMFVREIIDRLEGVHVLIDTSGYGDRDDFISLVSRSDLVYFDLKLVDRIRHMKYTGKDNGIILENLNILSGLGVPFVIRVPVIPGVTDTDSNLSEIAGTVKHFPGPGSSMPLKRGTGPDAGGFLGVEMLPYNRFAGGKYGSAGMKFNPGFDESAMPNLNTAIFKNQGIEVKVV
jgi:pyruvate formate lyase activating enzyme